MSKQVTVTDANGKKYKLGFTRKSIRDMESKGFNPEEVQSKPVSQLPILIKGVFATYNPMLSEKQVMDIWGDLKDKQDLLGVIIEMYAEPVTALFDEPKDNEKNATWEVSNQ